MSSIQADSTVSKETINRSMERFISRFEEIYGITISDVEGAVFSRVIRNDAPKCLPIFPIQLDVSSSAQPGDPKLLLSIDPLSVAFAKSTKLIDKLGLGRVNIVTCAYSEYVAYHVWFAPLIITIITTVDMNRGMIHSIVPELKSKLQDIRTELNMSKSINYEDH